MLLNILFLNCSCLHSRLFRWVPGAVTCCEASQHLRGALNLRDMGQLNLLVRKNYTKFSGLCVFMFPSLHRTGLKSLEMATCHFISAESFCQNDSTSAMWCVSKNRNKHVHWFMEWKIRYWKLNCYKFYFNLKSNNRTDKKKLWWWSSSLQRPCLMLLENVIWISDSVTSREILLPKSHDPAWKSQVSCNISLRVNINMEAVNLLSVSGIAHTSQNFAFVPEVYSHGFLLLPQSYHLLWFRQICALSTCEHMQGHQAPSCHRKKPLPAALSDKATAWDKLCGTQLQDPAPSQTVVRPEPLVGKRKKQWNP